PALDLPDDVAEIGLAGQEALQGRLLGRLHVDGLGICLTDREIHRPRRDRADVAAGERARRGEDGLDVARERDRRLRRRLARRLRGAAASAAPTAGACGQHAADRQQGDHRRAAHPHPLLLGAPSWAGMWALLAYGGLEIKNGPAMGWSRSAAPAWRGGPARRATWPSSS